MTIAGETRGCLGRHFCPLCDEIELNLGALDAPDQLPPYELWTSCREAWLPEFPVSQRYEGDREGASRCEG